MIENNLEHLKNCPFCNLPDTAELQIDVKSGAKFYYLECSWCGGRTGRSTKTRNCVDAWENPPGRQGTA